MRRIGVGAGLASICRQLTHLLVCKKVNAGQIAAHDVAVRSIGAELDSYGVIVRYKQRATNVKNDERKRTLELPLNQMDTLMDTLLCIQG